MTLEEYREDQETVRQYVARLRTWEYVPRRPVAHTAHCIEHRDGRGLRAIYAIGHVVGDLGGQAR